MAKVRKFGLNLLAGIAEYLLLLLILLSFSIRIGSFQTFLGRQAAAYFSSEWHTKVQIDKIDVVFFKQVYLDGLYLEDLHQDTLAYIQELKVKVHKLNFQSLDFQLRSLRLKNATVKLMKYTQEEKFNFQFLVDYFKKPSAKPAPKFSLSCQDVLLKNVRFVYDDQHKPHKDKGMDYAHLDVREVHLWAKKFRFSEGLISAQLQQLQAAEKAGFRLLGMRARAKVSQAGVFLSNFHIKTPNSDVHLPVFKMITGKYGNYLHFIDSVRFEAALAQSKVSMLDIVQFAPQLWGMNQKVYISAKVNEYVKNLSINDLKLIYGNDTRIQGNFNLIDFRNSSSGQLNEQVESLETSLEDIRQFRLPDKNGLAQYLDFPKQIEDLGQLKLRKIKLKGSPYDFTVFCESIRSELARIDFPGGIHLKYKPQQNRFEFNTGDSLQQAIHIDYLNLGKVLGQSLLGAVSGDLLLQGKMDEKAGLELSAIEGDFSQFEFNQYVYKSITLKKSSYASKVINASMSVNDPALSMDFDGKIDISKIQKLDFNLQLHRADLAKMNFIGIDSTQLSTQLNAHLFGENYDSYSGTIQLNQLVFSNPNHAFKVDKALMKATRHVSIDTIELLSPVLDAKIIGDINFKTFAENCVNQFKSTFSALFQHSEPAKFLQGEEFEYAIDIKNMQDLLNIVVPGLSIAQHTKINGSYSAFANYINLGLVSQQIRYHNMVASELSLQQNFLGSEIDVDYHIKQLAFNDSLKFNQIHYVADGENNQINSALNWGEENDQYPGALHCKTILKGPNTYLFNLSDAFFAIKGHRWDLMDSSSISVLPEFISVSPLRFEHEKQIIGLNGQISDKPFDKLNFLLRDFDLNDISSFFSAKTNLKGVLNATGSLSNLFTNPGIEGNAGIIGLFINKNEVGDINFSTHYNIEQKAFSMNGQLFYKGLESILFKGNYYVDKQENSLDLSAIFDNTNIGFVNSFLNPEVVTDIHGVLSGNLSVEGTLKEPALKGSVTLSKAGAKLGMFGTSFNVEGEIIADKYGFYLNNVPIIDQEGNAGSVVGAVLHDNFKNWNFDLSFDMENDALRKDPVQQWKQLPLKKFLVLNTAYKEGDFYYGKAYITGSANIFGYTDNLEITVNATTQKGTSINFPMYGQADLKEESDFIQFVSEDTIKKDIQKKLNLSSVALNLNFNITPDAQLKLIFNENTGDEILSSGNGKIVIGIDQQNHVSLEGVYTVKTGEYNFAMGPIKKNFYIEEGGTVQWTGDPYDAALNLKAYYQVNANLTDVMPTILTDDNTTNKDLIYCYLNLGGSLNDPSIGFDIAAPRASETGKTILNRVRGTQDELNRQFFSLLLFRKFQPLAGLSGSNLGAENAALEVVSNQINSVLDKVSKDYKLSVKMNSDQVNKQSSYEFGVSKGFLDDRLILSGNFGVNQISSSNKQAAASNFIGNVNLEYKLNQSGSFRVNIFNESNQFDIINKKNLGLFTQGVGLHYQESFNNINDFKLVQFILDFFRKPENRRYLGRKKNKKTPIPDNYLNNNENNAIKNEEDIDRQ